MIPLEQLFICNGVERSLGVSHHFEYFFLHDQHWAWHYFIQMHLCESQPVEGGSGGFYTWMGLLWSLWPWKSPGGLQSSIILVQHASALGCCWALAALNPISDAGGMWNMGPGSGVHVVVRNLGSLNCYELNLTKLAEQNRQYKCWAQPNRQNQNWDVHTNGTGL